MRGIVTKQQQNSVSKEECLKKKKKADGGKSEGIFFFFWPISGSRMVKTHINNFADIHDLPNNLKCQLLLKLKLIILL